MKDTEDYLVLDGLYSGALVKKIEQFLLKNRWTYTETARAKAGTHSPRHWACELSIDQPHIALLYEGFKKQLARRGKFELARVYCNAHVPSDCPLPHVDSKDKGDVTVLYYANSKWSYELAGETVFFKIGEIDRSFVPKPGRILVFDSTIEHCARVPTKFAEGLRLTVAFKFVRIRKVHKQGSHD